MTALRQTGRAGLELLGSLQSYSSRVLRDKARTEFYDDPDMAELGDKPLGPRSADELQSLIARARHIAEQSSHWRYERFFQRFVAENVYDRGIPATEEQRENIEQMLAALAEGANKQSLTLDPDLREPHYFENVEWHLMPGGWDGYDLSGPMFMLGVGPLIFARGGYAAVAPDADIGEQRRQVIGELQPGPYRRILDVGCGGISTIATLRAAFPDAEITGIDLSANTLTFAHLMAEKLELNIHLKQADITHSNEPDNHYDAVTAYAVFHEMDDHSAAQLVTELFRVLTPGGSLLISDPGPARGCTPWEAVLYDWETENREEPWFTDAMLRDLPGLLRQAGFTGVREYPLGAGAYPWIIRAYKPGEV